MTSIPVDIGNLQNLVILMLSQNEIKKLPLSVLKLTNLNALWLSENQCKPLPQLQNYSDTTGKIFLTCYLLPQRKNNLTGTINCQILICNHIII